jgi:hypothetical protein
MHVVAWAALVSCGNAGDGVKDPASAQFPSAEKQTLRTWLTCEDCAVAVLDSLASIPAATVVPLLAAALGSGPPVQDTMRLGASLRLHHAQLYEGEAAAETPAESTFVAFYLSAYDALYRARAAEGLGRVGGDSARKVLENFLASSRQMPTASVRAARRARASLGH